MNRKIFIVINHITLISVNDKKELDYRYYPSKPEKRIFWGLIRTAKAKPEYWIEWYHLFRDEGYSAEEILGMSKEFFREGNIFYQKPYVMFTTSDDNGAIFYFDTFAKASEYADDFIKDNNLSVLLKIYKNEGN